MNLPWSARTDLFEMNILSYESGTLASEASGSQIAIWLVGA